MICRNCGTEYDEKQGFCPCCGTEGEPALIAPEERKKLRVVRAVCAAALFGAVAALVVILRSGVFEKSAAETFVRLQTRALLEPVLALLEPGDGKKEDVSQDITVSINTEPLAFRLWCKVEAAADGTDILLNTGMDYMGLQMELETLTAKDGTAGFYAPLLDSHYYVIDEEALLKRLQEAGFLFDEVEDRQQFNLEKALKVGGMISKYSNILLSVVTDDNVTASQETLLIDGGQQTCEVYTFRPGAEELKAMFTELLTQLKEDEELKELLYTSCSSQDFFMAMYGVELDYDGYFNGGQPGREAFEAIWDESLDEALAEAADLAEQIAAGGFSWSVAANGRRIHRQSLSAQGEEFLLYESAGNGKESRYDLLRVGKEGESLTFCNRYTNRKGEAEGLFSVQEETEEILAVAYDWQTDERSFLNLPLGSSVLTADGETVELTVSRNEAGGIDHAVYASQLGKEAFITVTTSEQPSTARAPRATPVDVSGYSLEELEELLTDLLTGAGGIGFY